MAAHFTTQFVKLKDNVVHTMDVKNLDVKWMHKRGHRWDDMISVDIEEEYIVGNPTSSIQGLTCLVMTCGLKISPTWINQHTCYLSMYYEFHILAIFAHIFGVRR
jgi:hypothetical protein